MQTAARASRFGLVLAVLMMLFGVSTAVMSGNGTDNGNTGQRQASVTGESVSTAPSAFDDVQDWLRLSAGTLRAPATALPDTVWAVCPHAIGVGGAAGAVARRRGRQRRDGHRDIDTAVNSSTPVRVN